MKTKKLLSVILTGSMVLSMLAGCGGSAAGNAGTSAAAAAKTTAGAAAATTKAAGSAAGSTAAAAGTTAGKAASADKGNSKEVIAWYAPAPHPYFDDVEKGVKQFEKDENCKVIQQIGPDWTQASENEKVEALVAQGVTGLSIYPNDASGANGLYEEISQHGVNVINFGTDTTHPTSAKFAVTTDAKESAMQATEALIEKMGKKGKILNVLEVLEDPNTAKRKEGVEEVVKKYPDCSIVQEVAGIKTQEEAVSKIESALSANMGQIDGIICTGLITSVGMTQVMTDYYAKQGNAKHIYTMAIETDEGIMNGIKDGTIDATLAKNNFGHGYISCMLLKLLGEGYKPKSEDSYYINLPSIVVTKDNMDSYQADLDKSTKEMLGKLKTDFLTQ